MIDITHLPRETGRVEYVIVLHEKKLRTLLQFNN